jgi:D-serine dehydratase
MWLYAGNLSLDEKMVQKGKRKRKRKKIFFVDDEKNRERILKKKVKAQRLTETGFNSRFGRGNE